jgi:TonB family protein
MENFALHLALKSTLVLACAFTLATLLHARSAAARHLIWVTAWAAVLILPILSVGLPPLQIPVGTAFQAPETLVRTEAIAGAATTPNQTKPIAAAPKVGEPFNWRAAILLLWTAGTLLALAHMAAGWIALWRIRRQARPATAPELASLRKTLDLARDVDVLETANGAMPMAFGLLRPAVFLPEDAAQWTTERRRVVLLHELAHVRRGDLLAHLIARTALCLHWWNPLAWTAWRASLKERERATDDLVLLAGARATEYASHLLDIARSMQAPAAAVAMARPSQLEGRLGAILDSRIDRSTPRRASAAVAALAAFLLLLPVAAVRAQESIPADVEATIRVATSQKNFEMLDSIAKAATRQRKYDVTRKLLEASLEIRGSVSGTHSKAYGVGLLNLAKVTKPKDAADALYTKALAALGDGPESAPALIHLGTSAISTKNFDQAWTYFERARIADPAHAAKAILWMAITRDRQSNFEEAESLFKQSISLAAPGSTDAAVSMELYAQFLDAQKRPDEAKPIRENSIALRKSAPVKPSAGTYKIGSGILAPSLLTKVEPEYSDEARAAKYQGTVIVVVEIGTDGKVYQSTVTRSPGLGLDEKALDAIDQWVFKPGTKDGQPVNVLATIEVNFRLL